jgi:DNA-binding MarR family transcriptional regulator
VSGPARAAAGFDYDGQVGRLIQLSHDALQTRVLSKLADCGFPELSPPHVRVLLAAEAGPQRLVELANRCRMSRQALNHLLGLLVRAGYLGRSEDGNARMLSLSSRGRAAAAMITLAIDEFEQVYRTRVGAAGYQQFVAVLREIVANEYGGDVDVD